MQISANKLKKHYLHDAISRLANTHKTPLIKQNSWPAKKMQKKYTIY